MTRSTGIDEPVSDGARVGEPRRLLAGKVAVVTGAARGIGRAVAERFCEEGATVVIGDVDAAAGEQTAAALADSGGPGKAAFVAMDVTSEESVQLAAEVTLRRHGRIDCVVANAGVLLLSHVVDMDPTAWHRVLDVNLTGVFQTCRIFARTMIDGGEGGRIIVTSSLMGVRGHVENGAYAASKFGVIGLVESMAAELAPQGILVNAVCPGQVRSDMMEQLFRDRAALTGLSVDDVRAALLARIPLGRLAEPAEIAGAFVFLASDLAAYVTGQHLVIDGGWLLG